MPAPTPPAKPPPPPAPAGPCARCGRPGAAKFGDEFICDECYVACGSCCAEWFEAEGK